MITFSPRSICISRRSVSSPSISGINTSRITKSGFAPPPIASSPSVPLATAVTPNPSTSRSVWRYFRILGSSSIIRIFSLSAAISTWTFEPSRIAINLYFHWQQKLERASATGFAVHPDLAVMRLNQPFRDRQPQSHTGRRRIDAHKILKNLLMKLRRNPYPGVRHGNQHAIRLGTLARAPFLCRSNRRNAPLPKLRLYLQSHFSARRRMLQRIVNKIGHALLDLRIVE